MVGTLNSSVSQSVAPVLAKANIVQVSPANTNPTLTRGPKPDDAPQRIWPTYIRTATTDAFQGPFAADYALGEGGFKTAFVIHDKKTYGQGLAESLLQPVQGEGRPDRRDRHRQRERP